MTDQALLELAAKRTSGTAHARATTHPGFLVSHGTRRAASGARKQALTGSTTTSHGRAVA